MQVNIPKHNVISLATIDHVTLVGHRTGWSFWVLILPSHDWQPERVVGHRVRQFKFWWTFANRLLFWLTWKAHLWNLESKSICLQLEQHTRVVWFTITSLNNKWWAEGHDTLRTMADCRDILAPSYIVAVDCTQEPQKRLSGRAGIYHL